MKGSPTPYRQYRVSAPPSYRSLSHVGYNRYLRMLSHVEYGRNIPQSKYITALMEPQYIASISFRFTGNMHSASGAQWALHSGARAAETGHRVDITWRQECRSLRSLLWFSGWDIKIRPQKGATCESSGMGSLLTR